MVGLDAMRCWVAPTGACCARLPHACPSAAGLPQRGQASAWPCELSTDPW